MNEKQVAQNLVNYGFKLWKYSYTIRSEISGNLQVTGYLWGKDKPNRRQVLGTLDTRNLTLSYILEVEYHGQDISQTIRPV